MHTDGCCLRSCVLPSVRLIVRLSIRSSIPCVRACVRATIRPSVRPSVLRSQQHRTGPRRNYEWFKTFSATRRKRTIRIKPVLLTVTTSEKFELSNTASHTRFYAVPPKVFERPRVKTDFPRCPKAVSGAGKCPGKRQHGAALMGDKTCDP